MSCCLIYPQQLQFKVVETVELSISVPTLKSFLKGSTQLSCLIIQLLIPKQQHVVCLATGLSDPKRMIGQKELCFCHMMMCDVTKAYPLYIEGTILLRKVCNIVCLS